MNPRLLEFVIRVVFVLLCCIPATDTGYASSVDDVDGVEAVEEVHSGVVVTPDGSVEFRPGVFDVEGIGAIGWLLHPVESDHMAGTGEPAMGDQEFTGFEVADDVVEGGSGVVDVALPDIALEDRSHVGGGSGFAGETVELAADADDIRVANRHGNTRCLACVRVRLGQIERMNCGLPFFGDAHGQ